MEFYELSIYREENGNVVSGEDDGEEEAGKDLPV